MSKVKEIRKLYEEKVCALQKDIIERDTQIEAFNLKTQEYQGKIRDIQRDFDEQIQSFRKKLAERKQESERARS